MPASELYSRHSGNQYRGSSPNAPTPHRNGSHISSGNVPVGQSYQPTNHDKFAVRPNPPWAGERAQNIQDDAVGPRPYWFVTRGNGIRSPLIPADELPYGLHLQGVPRQISHVESRNMKDVGYMPYGGLVYVHARLSSLISSSQSPQGRSASPSAKSIASLSQCQSVQDAGDLEEHSRKERARNSRSRAVSF
ncbi:MAG: hypothetical protein M1820_010856 [Bogoriella megaspora]|nr:MAG: hypothetical protein M1820_010856 [Bogoriella megaspora]